MSKLPSDFWISITGIPCIDSVEGDRIETYPEHYPLMKEFDSADQKNRLSNFIRQKENQGKANVVRALCKREVFSTNTYKLIELGLSDCWAFDQLLAFCFLLNGKLAVSNKLLFKCTVGNKKYFSTPPVRINYLDAYAKIIESSIKNKDVLKILRVLDERYLDKKILFFQEYYSILDEFCSKSVLFYSETSIPNLERVFSLVEQKRYRESSLLAKKHLINFNCDEKLESTLEMKLVFRLKQKNIALDRAKKILNKILNDGKN